MTGLRMDSSESHSENRYGISEKEQVPSWPNNNLDLFADNFSGAFRKSFSLIV